VVGEGREGRSPAPELRNLDGADAYITIAVERDGTSITIRDYNNIDETEFVSRLRQRIEERLTERFVLRSLRYDRQSDLFIPNS
jgi:hypothetical protein